ncbi:3166_t:CDS:2 [Entrophospora sp. SA101]|nr:3166_t:CDS:2 [Entrophospora sp. SA101]
MPFDTTSYSSSDSISSDSECESDSIEFENYLAIEATTIQHHLSRNKKYEKWMLPILDAREVMMNQQNFEWSTLLKLRFLNDLENFIKKLPHDKEYRKTLKHSEAKACTIIQQKLKQMVESWNSIIQEHNQIKPPIPITSKNQYIVDEIEKFLMISPHNHISFRGLNLTKYPQHMKKLNIVLNYYYSFSPIIMDKNLSVHSLTILDLSRNKLKVFAHEILFFRNLKVLRLANNLFQYFPPYITRLNSFTVLLGIKFNPLRKSNVSKINSEYKISSLSSPLNNNDGNSEGNCEKTTTTKIPSLCDLYYVQDGYLCECCRMFISTSSPLYLPKIIEYMNYLWNLEKNDDDDLQRFNKNGYNSYNNVIVDSEKSTNVPLLRRFCMSLIIITAISADTSAIIIIIWTSFYTKKGTDNEYENNDEEVVVDSGSSKERLVAPPALPVVRYVQEAASSIMKNVSKALDVVLLLLVVAVSPIAIWIHACLKLRFPAISTLRVSSAVLIPRNVAVIFVVLFPTSAVPSGLVFHSEPIDQDPRVYIGGTFGRSKTCFGDFLITELIKRNHTVVIQTIHNPGILYICQNGEGTLVEKSASIRELENFDNWYICDGVKPRHASARSVLISSSSSKESIRNEFMKWNDDDRKDLPSLPECLYMPTWSFDELMDCHERCYPNISIDNLRSLFAISQTN